ncbi:hypothetical protein L291_1363 [Acinetobacter guillouiae MSP4-18]|nr:hypothetical protein L291_1363 [Acinetobacter guillouiae MSP4-18]
MFLKRIAALLAKPECLKVANIELLYNSISLLMMAEAIA